MPFSAYLREGLAYQPPKTAEPPPFETEGSTELRPFDKSTGHPGLFAYWHLANVARLQSASEPDHKMSLRNIQADRTTSARDFNRCVSGTAER